MRASPAELSRRAREIAAECRSLETELTTTQNETLDYLKSINSSSLVDVFIKGDQVQWFTTLTLVYQAIPAPEGSTSRFCDECLNTARGAMKAHQDSMGSLHFGSYVESIYVHWWVLGLIPLDSGDQTNSGPSRNLMLTPFAPFFVLFCHIVETLSADDLRILQEFVASVERLRDGSETIRKLCRVFQVYRDVAVVYIEAKSQHQEDQTMVPIGDEFDMYLSQLGFMPLDEQAMIQTAQPSASNPMPAGGSGSGQAAQMADWFSGSRNMFGLLEEDLSQIDGVKWMPQGSSM